MDSSYLQVHKDNARNVTCKLGHQNNKYIIIIIVKLGSPKVSYKLCCHSQHKNFESDYNNTICKRPNNGSDVHYIQH